MSSRVRGDLLAAEEVNGGSATPEAGPAPRKVVSAPRLRRSPLMVAASVAAICLGALLAVWAWSATSDSREVVAVRSTVMRGQVIKASDLMTVQVGADPALSVVPGAQLGSLVGKRAATDLVAGSLVTQGAAAAAVVPAAGKSVVGVALPPSLMPGESLQPGDRVRVVSTPAQGGDVKTDQVDAIAAVVVDVRAGAEQGRSVVSVEVPEADAALLAARAATGRVALVLDSRER